MKIFNKFILYFLIFFYSSDLFSTELINLRFGTNGSDNRIVIDLTNDVSFNNKINDDKVTISFNKKVTCNYKLQKNNFVERFEFNKNSNELLLKFKKTIFSPNIYLLKKKDNKFSRIVLDFKNIKLKKKSYYY